MILRSSPTSPFGRKVKLAAHALGLMDRIEIVNAAPADPSDSLRNENPLGKMPALLLEGGDALYDSRVIVEYLADLAGDRTLLPKGADRWEALRLQALADGMADAAILQFYEERFRPEAMRSADWVDYQQGKIDRGLDVLDAAPPRFENAPHIGHLALAATLAWFDFRFSRKWRDGRERLAAWQDDAASRLAGFAETAPR
jgi:glutathione S-transferase